VLPLWACGEKIDAVQPLGDGGCGSATVTYEGQARAIFAQHCTRCHSLAKAGGDRNGAPASVNFDSFAEAAKSAELALARAQNGIMPPSGSKVPPAELQTLGCWISQGKKER
jgi:uncharacterized membrane protein